MNRRLVIYEPAMCCSSGVCGPSPDEALINLQDTLEEVRKLGAEVERFSITQSPKKFWENQQVVKLMQEHQLKALPITAFDGIIVKFRSYPTLDEFKTWAQYGARSAEPSMSEPRAHEGCCSGDNACDIPCNSQDHRPRWIFWK